MSGYAGTRKAGSEEREPDALKKLLRELRTGAFEEAKHTLLYLGVPLAVFDKGWQEDIGERFFHRGPSPHENRSYIRFITLTAEACDQFGHHTLSEQCLKCHSLQTAVDRHLQTAEVENPISYDAQKEQWEMLRQRLYFWLQVARVFYRKGELESAEKGCKRCLALAQNKLHPKPEGLIAELYYAEAAIARQRSDLDEAIQFYGQALAAAFERLRRKIDLGSTASAQRSHDERANSELQAARYLIGKASAPLGYCFIEKGMLREARIVLTAGQMLLWGTTDHLTQQYCHLLFARLLRHEAGRDPQRRHLLDDARVILANCVKSSPNHRPRFQYRAYYETGFVALYCGEFSNAEIAFSKVLQAAAGKDARWEANTLVAMARLRFYQEKFDQALDLANKAENVGRNNPWCKARALVMQARAEVALSAKSSSAARRNYLDSAESKLLRLPELSNPSARALPLLLLARICQSEGRVSEAREHFEMWQAISEQVQYQAIHSLAEQVEREIYPTHEAFVNLAELKDEDLNRKKLSHELERYIFQRLEATGRKDEEKAQIWSGRDGTRTRTAYIRRRKQILGH